MALHAKAAAGAHNAAWQWVGLMRASRLLEDVWWWSEGAAALKSSYPQARALCESRVGAQGQGKQKWPSAHAVVSPGIRIATDYLGVVMASAACSIVLKMQAFPAAAGPLR